MPNQSAIATPHPQAARAGQLAIQAGGNAVDAAAAALLAICILMPQQVGLGGYGGSLILHKAGSATPLCIDFTAPAPKAFDRALYPTFDTANHGPRAVCVPTVIAGLALAVQDHGLLPFSAACQHALSLADNGVPVSPTEYQQILKWHTSADPTSRKALFPHEFLKPNQLWTQPDQAKLLRLLIDQGPAAFYHGDVPRTICTQLRAAGGILAEDDFSSYQPRYVTPLSISYRNHQILTPAPPSGGLTTLQILKILEHFDLASIEPFSPAYYHLFAEATKLAWRDRQASAGDPEFVDLPLARLLSDAHAAANAAHIRANLPTNCPPFEKASGPHTANVCCADSFGNLVSLTATQGFLFGSQIAVDGLGLVLNHGMSRFEYANPNSPNAPAPRKRPFHNMAPTLVLSSPFNVERSTLNVQRPTSPPLPRHAVGLPGGTKIVTVTAQLLVNLIDFKLSPHDAVHAPRIHLETEDPIAGSSKVPDATLASLRDMGHTTRRGQDNGGPPTEIAGNANALSIDPITRTPTASSEPGPTAALNF